MNVRVKLGESCTTVSCYQDSNIFTLTYRILFMLLAARCLFNDAFNCSVRMALNDRTIMNEMERIWKEADFDKLKVITHLRLPGIGSRKLVTSRQN
jgi:hypothetical protein